MAHSKEVPDIVAEIDADCADSCRQVSKVRTRCFYNSKYKIKSVFGLFAKGNKKKYLVGSSDCQIDANSREVTKNVTPDKGVWANNVSSVGNKNVDVLDNHVKCDTQLCTVSPGVNGIEQNDRWDRKHVAPVCPDQDEKPINNIRGLVGCEKDREVDTLTGNNGCVPIYDIGVSCCDEKFVNSLFSGQKGPHCVKIVFILVLGGNKLILTLGFCPLLNL